jgi:hypothetical protein
VRVEVENAFDESLGVAHLHHGTAADHLMEPLVAPVLAHLRLHHVLHDGAQFRAEGGIQLLQDIGMAAHEGVLLRVELFMILERGNWEIAVR